MKVVHTIASLVPEIGGPARTVISLSQCLAQLGVSVELMSTDVGQKFSRPIVPPAELIKTTLVPCRFSIGLRQIWAPGFGKQLTQLVANDQIDVIHDHGIWLPTNFSAARVAKQTGRPLIVSARGSLEPWALRHGRIKKQLAWRLYQGRILHSARVLHATSRLEATHMRQLGLCQPIALIPNGVTIPAQIENIERKYPAGHTRTILFLSRIHPKKGLLNLVKAFKSVSPRGWRVVIAGPDEGDHLAEIRAEIETAGLQGQFEFIGAVDDSAKWNVYQQADLFVLPTFSENFGVVVAEALASGLPVITTQAAPWEELTTHDCGWWIPVGVESLSEALATATQLTDMERERMGQNGQQLIADQYDWESVALKMLAVYEWVLGRRTQPDWVISD